MVTQSLATGSPAWPELDQIKKNSII